MNRPVLSYSFARAHGILLVDRGPDYASLLLPEEIRPDTINALAEVRRMLGTRLRIDLVPQAIFDARHCALHNYIRSIIKKPVFVHTINGDGVYDSVFSLLCFDRLIFLCHSI